ncbi:MAG: choice-of-anchor A family protein [Proteobacteria bacterium]|nr:choice-of-anchor A family protein [Pseudomonadota bacterium]
MRTFLAAGSALCLTLLLAATPARAALTASELTLDEAVLNQFNVVTTGDYSTSNDTEGRMAIGGNLTGSLNNVCFNGCSGNTTPVGGTTYGTLNVWGSVNANVTMGGGSAYIKGSRSGSLNLNGGSTLQSSFPFASPMPFATPLTDLASSIAADAQSDTGTVAAGALVQNATPQITATKAAGTYGGKNYGFITISLANLATYVNFGGIVTSGFTSGVDAVFVVVTGAPGATSATLPGMNATNGDPNVIWDFVDATSLTFSGSWYGDILAPDATVTNKGDLNGTVFAQSINQLSEIHNYNLPTDILSGLPTTTVSQSSPVVEPSTLAVLFVGIFGLAFARRKAAHAAA